VPEIRICWGRLLAYRRGRAAQLRPFADPGAADDRIYIDDGLTGADRAPPDRREVLAAYRSGDRLA
jgi:hypothetical protein